MGQMSKILEARRKATATATNAIPPVLVEDPPSTNPTPRLPRDPFPPEHLAALIPCRSCGCPIAWESIYFDGELRCVQCQPFPSIEFIGRKVAWQQGWVGANGSSELGYWEQKIIDGKLGGESGRPHSIDPTLVDDGFGEGAGSDGQDNGQDDQEAASWPREHETESEANERYDRFVEGRTRCGRTFYARRGWDQPSSPYFSQRLCMAVALAGGLEEAEEILGKASRENSKVLR